MVDQDHTADSPNRKPCRRCGKLSPLGARGRPRAFCDAQCESAWRSEWYKGNKHAVGHKPTNGFPKGHQPWTKGRKGIRLSPETEFKKGQIGITDLPVGSTTIRIDKNGRRRAFIKVAFPNVWIMRATFAAVASGVQVPRGCVVHHKDRDTLNDEPSNLQVMTRGEHRMEHHEDLLKSKGLPC